MRRPHFQLVESIRVGGAKIFDVMFAKGVHQGRRPYFQLFAFIQRYLSLHSTLVGSIRVGDTNSNIFTDAIGISFIHHGTPPSFPAVCIHSARSQ